MLPSYVDTKSIVLHQPSRQLSLPFSEEDLRDIALLTAKYESEQNCAGLAAPQIGIGKAIIIFAVADSPELKKWRKDLTQTMPKTVWINPSFEAATEDMTEDWEGCFSVPETAGLVKRYAVIHYSAFDVSGKKVEGVAEGYLARVIQHEIDHTMGKLFIEKATQKLSMDDYKAMRHKMMHEQ